MTGLSTWSTAVGALLSHPGEQPTRHQVALTVQQGTIQAIAPADTVDQPHWLAIPALANAHDHGRGVNPVVFGGLDQALELWLPGLKLSPPLPIYETAALAMARMARSGVGSVMHCHNPVGPDVMAEMLDVCRAARDVGVRLGLAVSMNDRNALAYGSAERILSLVPPSDRAAVDRLWNRAPQSPQAQIQWVDDLAAACADDDRITIQYGPRGPQWCSPKLLEAIAAASATTGRRVHMHVLETRYQREWADAHYPEGLIAYLDDIGLLSPRLTIAHGIWLTPAEMERLADRGVTVSVNTSSNLRLRSGLAPLRQLVQAGVPTAFGLDGMALNDDDDALKELRLNYHLHCQAGMAQTLTPAQVFRAHRYGAIAVTHRTDVGTLAPGQVADIAMINRAVLMADTVPGMVDEATMLLARGTAQVVDALFVAGRPVVQAGRVLGIDEAAIAATVRQALAHPPDRVYSLQPVVQSYQRALTQFYRQGWHQTPD
jgi:cytosine/adenosine deaminase-related metal-dependent hydrolase